MTIQELRSKNMPLCQANKSFNKVFGIGANKTGTTSLQAIFYSIGLNVAPQIDGEIFGIQAAKGNIGPLKKYVESYDAFQDAPFSVKTVFAQMDALFENSKFILTIREPEDWYDSILRFHMKCMKISHKPTKKDIENFHYIYDGYNAEGFKNNWVFVVKKDLSTCIDWEKAYDKSTFIQLYQARNETVIRHFSARENDLLVINLTKEKTTAKIIEFLELPTILTTAMPHANKT
jgi:hypothetical protein